MDIFLKSSLPALSRKLWKIVSEYIRRKDADEDGTVKCFTCLNTHHWKEIDAGHYVPSSVSLALRFNEKNVHPQCTACNRFRRGNLTQYAVALEKKYGLGILQELDTLRHSVARYSRSDYEEMIRVWSEKLKSLDVDIFGYRS